MDRARYYLLRFAQERESELRWAPDGWPNEADLAKRLHVSAPTLSKFMRGIPDQREGVLKPRGNEYRALAIIDGLVRWGKFESFVDVERNVEKCPRWPPRPGRGRNRAPLPRLK